VKKLVIFDMDGTILDTLEDLRDATNYILRQNSFKERSLEEIRSFVGNGARLLIDRATDHTLGEEELDRLYIDFIDYYNPRSRIKTRPYHGIMDMLSELKKRGYLMAVVSNKPDPAVVSLVDHYFKGCFEAYCGERPEIKKKPAPDMVRHVLEELDILPSEAIYVGDSDTDIETGRNSGLEVISVTWGFRDRDFLIRSGADTLVESPMEIVKHLET